MGSVAEADKTFDYVIVGGGTAGLTLADRLTEDKDLSVLVLEAGEDHNKDPLVLTPGLVVAQYGKAEYDWNFSSPPQPRLNNRQINQPRGKGLGGSSALNFLMLVYPSRGSIDAWATLGNEGWDYDTLVPYFRKFATVHAPPQAAKDVVGLTYHDDSVIGDGPVQVSFSEGYGSNNAAWMGAFAKFGLEMTSDMRTGNALGAFQQPGSIDPATKTRSFAGTAHYSDEIAARPNLTVMTGALVKKVLFDTTGAEPVATGVLVQTSDGAEKTIKATEVILSAGSLMSPQILELSGVGSKDLLASLDIPVVLDNPAVGENLQDHPIVCQSFEVADGVLSGDVLRDTTILNALVAQYQSGGAGPLGQSNISVAYAPLMDAAGVSTPAAKQALFDTHAANIQTPDAEALRDLLLRSPDEPFVEYMLFPGQINTTLPAPGSMADYLTPSDPRNYLTVLTLLNHPFSRGSVHITSPSAGVLPRWDPNFNANPIDEDIAARHVQFVETLVATEPLRALFKPDGARIPADARADSAEGARDVVRQTMVSDFHPAGSCAMLPRDKGGVVDSKLRVHGVRGLRVVDASIFPLEPIGNIQSVVYAVAERAADIIKEDRRAKA